jgi:hypothetical protein
MSALSHKRTYAVQKGMSALPRKRTLMAGLAMSAMAIADMLTERRRQNQYSALSASPTVVNLIGGLFASFCQL